MLHLGRSILHQKLTLLSGFRCTNCRIRDPFCLFGHNGDVIEYSIYILLGTIDIHQLLIHARRYFADGFRHMHGSFRRLMSIGREFFGGCRYLFRGGGHLANQLMEMFLHDIERLRHRADFIRRGDGKLIDPQITVSQLAGLPFQSHNRLGDAAGEGKTHPHHQQKANDNQRTINHPQTLNRRKYKIRRHSHGNNPARSRHRRIGQ